MEQLKIKTIQDYVSSGKTPEILFWVGCAGSFDERAKKITKAFAKLLTFSNIEFAILGKEESCTGDPAKRAGNEFLFQLQAKTNIEVLNGYEIKKIVTACPHCFNTLKNEYPQLGGNYEVLHHTQFLKELIEQGKLNLNNDYYKDKKITFHDPCYLSRANNEYDSPRYILEKLQSEIVEMKRCKQNGLCCGAGGAQMFKEPEKGNKDINIERTEQAIQTKAEIIATGCPFCNTMITDGIKNKNLEKQINVIDLAELVANSNNL